jgi:hypothetical protein
MIERPRTSSTLLSSVPVSEAFTIGSRPLRSAEMAMIISGTLPIVPLSRPPSVAPRRSDRFSVASPIRTVKGATASTAVAKTRIGLAR